VLGLVIWAISRMYSWMSCSDIVGVWKKRIEEKDNIFSEQRRAETEQKKSEIIPQFEKVDAFLKY
jgi:hypothetical protein